METILGIGLRVGVVTLIGLVIAILISFRHQKERISMQRFGYELFAAGLLLSALLSGLIVHYLCNG
jgi:hypothetical protein